MNNFEFKPEATAHGIKIDNTTIDYVEAVQRLNDGEYDNPCWHGLRIMQCIAEADDAGFLGRFSVDMKVAQWLISLTITGRQIAQLFIRGNMVA